MIPTLYILCGPPGAGKTKWANNFIDEMFNEDIRYVSRDEIRLSMAKNNEDYFSNEREVFEKFVGTICATLIDGFDIIADATHLNKFSRKKLTNAIDKRITNYKIIYVVFNTDIVTCIKRNKTRTNVKKIDEKILRELHQIFERPTFTEDNRVIGIYQGR